MSTAKSLVFVLLSLFLFLSQYDCFVASASDEVQQELGRKKEVVVAALGDLERKENEIRAEIKVLQQQKDKKQIDTGADSLKEERVRAEEAPASGGKEDTDHLSSANGKCHPLEIQNYFKWDSVKKQWYFEPNNECGFHGFTPEQVVKMLKGKTILFVGDSTVRNLAITLLAYLCNPYYMSSCSLRPAWPFATDVNATAVSCSKLDEAKRYRNFGSVDSSFITPEKGWCMDPKKIKFNATQLNNLTSNILSGNKTTRSIMWGKNALPALLKVEVQGITLMLVEGSCVHGKKDGLHRVFNWLQRYREAEERGDLNSMYPKQPWQGKLPKWDLIVSSAGFHCAYGEYPIGDSKEKMPWYDKVAYHLNLMKRFSPIMWIEPSNCSKPYASNHYVFYGGGPAHRRDKDGNLIINLKKYASCPFMDTFRGQVMSAMAGTGITISPSRFLTIDDWPLREKCPFQDKMHPVVACYKDMLQVHLNSMKIALDKGNRFSPNMTMNVFERINASYHGAPLPSKIEEEEGAHDREHEAAGQVPNGETQRLDSSRTGGGGKVVGGLDAGRRTPEEAHGNLEVDEDDDEAAIQATRLNNSASSQVLGFLVATFVVISVAWIAIVVHKDELFPLLSGRRGEVKKKD